METDATTSVADALAGSGSEGTPTTGSVTQGVTPTQSSDDAEKRILEVTKKAEQAERDLNAMKSSFQKSEAELRAQLKQQNEEFQRKLRDLAVSKMDTEERKTFEANELLERNKNFELEARRLEQELAERDQKDKWKDYFITQGIPVEKLNTSGGLNDLVQSGHTALSELVTTLRKAKEEKTKSPDDDNEVKPPNVLTGNGNTNTSKPGWPELVKRYGSMEQVYRKVELGQLPASIIPPD